MLRSRIISPSVAVLIKVEWLFSLLSEDLE
jgi:hypothetical protein